MSLSAWKLCASVFCKQRCIFDHPAKRAEIDRMEREAAAPDFWNDNRRAQEHLKALNNLKRLVEPWEKLEREVDEALEMALLLREEPDEAMAEELAQQTAALERQLEELEFRNMLSDPDDVASCYLHIHPGAGGTESCDWASMLLRMYTRWAERHGYKVSLVDIQPGDEAGIDRATLFIEGEYAYGYLKAENGVHRLVRISPFDANKRRHTSFASVYAYPDVEDDVEVEINEKDLKIETFRAGGRGGQHVNVTDSAVRITHLPTKIVVSCQNERSQHQNKAVAMKILRARLYQYYKEQREAELAAKEGEKLDIAWGSQIRSYVFQPYQLVKDLRTGVETSNIEAVMDGEIDMFIEAWLRQQMGKKTQTSA
ncbi:MAG: peptide chain release factor 2 [Candidatus Sumerlaea chitinivorans]|nr:peptide chain release factor 2 [Candidatus Sumerlaea chitinivorans]